MALVLLSPDPKRLYASHAELKSFARPIVPALHPSWGTSHDALFGDVAGRNPIDGCPL